MTNINELDSQPLDWAVAKCEGKINQWYWVQNNQVQQVGHWYPSTCWHQGGPIIDRERIAIKPIEILEGYGMVKVWKATINDINQQIGPTALIAAMRCYVASKLGNNIEVPKELL